MIIANLQTTGILFKRVFGINLRTPLTYHFYLYLLLHLVGVIVLSAYCVSKELATGREILESITAAVLAGVYWLR